MNGTRFRDNLSFFDVLTVDTTQKRTDVITGHSFIEHLTEHFKTRNNRRTGFLDETYDFRRITNFRNTTLNTARSNRTTSGNREHVFHREKERFVIFTLRIRDVCVDRIHQLQNALAFRSSKDISIGSTRRSLFKSLQSRTLDDRRLVARESVFREQVTDLFFYEFEKFRIVNLIGLVHEYYDIRHAYLTSEQDVLTSLGHRSVRSCNNQDSTVHLRSTRDHVLDIVSVSRAVNVRGVDRDTTSLLFRRLVDFIVLHLCSLTFGSHNHRDSCGQSRFAVVNVADRANVNVGFASVEFSLSHFRSSNKFLFLK